MKIFLLHKTNTGNDHKYLKVLKFKLWKKIILRYNIEKENIVNHE